MVKTTLVETDKKAGESLIRKMDESRASVTAALWFYLSESDEWRLMLATPLVDKEGPKKVYERIQRLLEGQDVQYDLSLDNIAIVSPDDQLITLLKKAIKTEKDSLSSITFTRNVINNTFIENAYIYRMS